MRLPRPPRLDGPVWKALVAAGFRQRLAAMVSAGFHRQRGMADGKAVVQGVGGIGRHFVTPMAGRHGPMHDQDKRRHRQAKHRIDPGPPGLADQQPRHVGEIVPGTGKQRHRIDPQAGGGPDPDTGEVAHHPDGKGAAATGRSMAMAMMIMAARGVAVGVAAHGAVVGGEGRASRVAAGHEKGGPCGPPFQTTTGAGEEIRTLDFNLGKVALYP